MSTTASMVTKAFEKLQHPDTCLDGLNSLQIEGLGKMLCNCGLDPLRTGMLALIVELEEMTRLRDHAERAWKNQSLSKNVLRARLESVDLIRGEMAGALKQLKALTHG